MDNPKEELLNFAEALLDVNRLRIVGELARGSGRIDTLAARVGMDPADLRPHLEILARTGVITLDGPESYRIDERKLEEMSKRQFSRAKETQAREPDLRALDGFSPTDAKAIRGFTLKSGRITHLPSIHKPEKLMAVLRYAVQDVQPGRTYTEAEFNLALSRFTHDPASIRRELVDQGFVERKADGSAYWLKEA